jgi:hypothetical protein
MVPTRQDRDVLHAAHQIVLMNSNEALDRIVDLSHEAVQITEDILAAPVANG